MFKQQMRLMGFVSKQMTNTSLISTSDALASSINQFKYYPETDSTFEQWRPFKINKIKSEQSCSKKQ